MRLATLWLIEESKATTFSGTETFGKAGTIQTRAEAEPGAVPPGGGSACVAGADQPNARTALRTPPASSSGATARISAKRPAQAKTRLARIAVLVQNSRVVGPRSTTER